MKNLIFIFVLTVTLIYSSPLVAKVYHTRDSALKNVFSDADTIEKKTLFLDDEDVKKIEALAKVKLDTKIFTFYIGKKKEAVLGYVIFGSHVIRTKPEVYMVVINPDASIKFVEILAFYEPEEYLPIKKWFEQFVGRVLDDTFFPKRGIVAVSGATLSVNGITQEIRKALAVFQIMIIGEKK